MVTDIFYPILTLKVTVLACFMKNWGLASARESPWTPWWAYSSPHTPSCKKNDVLIFFVDSPHATHDSGKLSMLIRLVWFPCKFTHLKIQA